MRNIQAPVENGYDLIVLFRASLQKQPKESFIRFTGVMLQGEVAHTICNSSGKRVFQQEPWTVDQRPVCSIDYYHSSIIVDYVESMISALESQTPTLSSYTQSTKEQH